jgi:hypothetical protein
MPAFRPGNALFGAFLQGGGATFWQAKNGGFWGPRRRARLVPRVAKTVRNPSRRDGRIATLQSLLEIK